MQRLLDEIDLHVVAMLLLIAPALFLSWWPLIVLLLVPQGRIYVRSFWDYPAFGRRSWTYLIANEFLVVGSVGILAGGRFALTMTWR